MPLVVGDQSSEIVAPGSRAGRYGRSGREGRRERGVLVAPPRETREHGFRALPFGPSLFQSPIAAIGRHTRRDHMRRRNSVEAFLQGDQSGAWDERRAPAPALQPRSVDPVAYASGSEHQPRRRGSLILTDEHCNVTTYTDGQGLRDRSGRASRGGGLGRRRLLLVLLPPGGCVRTPDAWGGRVGGSAGLRLVGCGPLWEARAYGPPTPRWRSKSRRG